MNYKMNLFERLSHLNQLNPFEVLSHEYIQNIISIRNPQNFTSSIESKDQLYLADSEKIESRLILVNVKLNINRQSDSLSLIKSIKSGYGPEFSFNQDSQFNLRLDGDKMDLFEFDLMNVYKIRRTVFVLMLPFEVAKFIINKSNVFNLESDYWSMK